MTSCSNSQLATDSQRQNNTASSVPPLETPQRFPRRGNAPRHSHKSCPSTPQGTEPPVERDRDRRVKKWLVEGGAKEESLQWISFPDRDEFLLLADRQQPYKNYFSGSFAACRFTPDQVSRMCQSGKSRDGWVAEATANGEVSDRMWPPM